MKRRKSVGFLFCHGVMIAALFICLPFVVCANDDFTLWAAGSDNAASSTGRDTGNLPIDAVAWWYDSDDSTYYLFVPATADLANLKIWFTGADAVSVNDIVLTNGAVTDAFSVPGSFRLLVGGSSYSLTVMQSANVGTLFLDTASGSMENIDNSGDHSVSESGNMLLLDCEGNVEYNNALTQVKGRGNSTWSFEKKPYQIKLDKKTDLFDMGAGKTWILLANYADRSLMRNALIFNLADNIGLPYTPKSVYVDVYANHQYLGNYQLAEKNEIGKNRVEITDLEGATEDANGADLDTYQREGAITGAVAGSKKWVNIPNDPADITGGYLLEFEFPSRYPAEASGFVTDRGQAVVIKSPEYATEAEVAYISAFVQDLEDAIYSEDGYNGKGKHYSEYLDVESAVMRYLIEEWSLNNDGGLASFYLYKDADTAGDGVLHCGPIWDYDLSFGNQENRTIAEADIWLTNQWSIIGASYPCWYGQLFYDPDFVNRVNETYASVFEAAATEVLNYEIDATAARINRSAAMNFVVWEKAFSADNLINTGTTFAANCSYLESFIAKRMAFLSGGFFLNWDNPYIDVSSSAWYYEAVKYVADAGLMLGTSSTIFAPETTMNRAMAVTILSRMSGEEIPNDMIGVFTDVPVGKWYSDAVAWAENKGIVVGRGNGNFDPLAPLTREEMAQMLYNYARYLNQDVTVSQKDTLAAFTDGNEVSAWALAAVTWAVDKGILNGMTATTLSPKGNTTRAQAAALLQRTLHFFDSGA